MKTNIKFFLLPLLFFATSCCCAFAQDYEWTDNCGITWSFYTETTGEGEDATTFAAINGSSLCTGSVKVPESVYVGETSYPVKRVVKPEEGKSIFGPEVENIDFSDVEEIWTEYDGFFGCENLFSVTANSLTGVGPGLFSGSSVAYVYLSKKCNAIWSNGFGGTWRLEYVGNGDGLLEGVERLDDGAFANSGIRYVDIPACTHIGVNAFANCQNLTGITLGATIPEFDKDENGTPITPFLGDNVNFVNLHVPENQMAAYQSADIWEYFNYAEIPFMRSNEDGDFAWVFSFNEDKTEATVWGTSRILGGTLNIPETFTYEICEGEEFKYIPIPVTSIADRAFANYADLQRVNLPSGLKYVGKDAFVGDEQLKAVAVSNKDVVLDISDGGISTWMKGSTTFCVPENMLESYIADENWKDIMFFVESQDMSWEDPLTNITWYFATNSFDEAIESGYRATAYGSTECPESVAVPQNVYVAGKPYAVKRLERREGFRLFSDNTKTVNLEDVEDCEGWSLFVGNPQIENVTAHSLSGVNDGLFYDTQLKSIELSEKCKGLGFRALNGTQIQSINLVGCEYLGALSLAGCHNLTDVYIGDVIRSFGEEDGKIVSPFAGMNTYNINLHIPDGADADLYKSAEVWGNFHYLDQGGQLYSFTAENGDMWSYSINDDNETATAYGIRHEQASFNSSVMVIDKVIHEGKQYPVTTLGEGAFANCTNLHYLGLPASVTKIQKDAIYGCDELNHIFIYNEDCVVSLPENTFDGIPTADLFLILPSKMTDSYAEHETWGKLHVYTGFKDDHSYVFDYTDDNGVVWTVEPMFPMGPYVPDPEYPLAWEHENSLWYLGMEDKVRLVDMKNYGKDVDVPETVKINNQTYFVYHINGDNSNAPEVIEGREPFAGKSDIETIHLPQSVREIGWGAFRGNSSLTSINTEMLNGLNDWTFGDCEKLTTLDLTNARGIGAGALIGLTGLISVTLSDKCIDIADAAFSGCSNLTSVGDVSGVESVGREAFSGTTSLKSLNFSDKLKQIGNQAFQSSGVETVGCTSGVVSMGWGAFRQSQIKSVDLSNCALLDEWVFDSCNELEEVGSVAHLLSVGNGVFWDCIKLKTLDLSNKCTFLGHRALAGCPNLTSVGDLTGCDYVESYAFDGDRSLVSLELPKASHIGENAFLNCNATVTYGDGNKFIPETDPDYSLYVDDVELTSTSIIIPLKLRTKGDICAFQSDIFISEDKKATSFGINSERVDENATSIVSFSNGENGRCRSMATSLPCLPFLGEDGVIATLTLDLGTETGDFTPVITNIVLATADGKAIYVGANDFTFNVDKAGTVGDLNGDGTINTVDVVALSKLVLSDEPIVTKTNDINGDGKLTITDVTALINQIVASEK